MIAVIFEVSPDPDHKQAYLEIAAKLAPQLDGLDGFISIERFESLSEPGKILSLSFWRDEEAIARWRNLESHREAQTRGRGGVFRDYRLRVAGVIRDYSLAARDQAPQDSQSAHAENE